MSREREILIRLAETLDPEALIEEGIGREEIRTALTRAAAMFKESVPPPPRGEVPAGGLTINVDGAARGNPGPAGAGVVIRAGGKLLEGIAQYLGRVTNNVAEYSALILALERAHELGASEVKVFSDSELMVRQLNGQYKVKNPGLQKLYGRARELADGFGKFTIRHVPRAQNAEADRMANRAIDEFDGDPGED